MLVSAINLRFFYTEFVLLASDSLILHAIFFDSGAISAFFLELWFGRD